MALGLPIVRIAKVDMVAFAFVREQIAQIRVVWRAEKALVVCIIRGFEAG